MDAWFFLCLIGMACVVPLHFRSVERLRLRERHGEEGGDRIGDVYGLASGWGFFLLWIGVWISPQPRFTLPGFSHYSISIPLSDLTIPFLHSAISLPFLVSGLWLGVKGLLGVTLRVAETHRAETVVTTGVYSIVRHPQYLGGLLAHIGISFMLSAWYSLLCTPLVILLNYLIARKEEEELAREFGEQYEEYQRRVPMLIPRLRR